MKFIFFFMLIAFSCNALAQPGDAQIKKDAMSPGILDIAITGKGTLRWNSDIMQNEYCRAIQVTRNSEYAGIKLVVRGDMVYRVSGNTYTYWKFRTVDNNYLGIPNPTSKEINDILSTNWAQFYGGYYSSIVKLHSAPVLADEPQWLWHTPNSVEFKMKLKYDDIVSNTEVETAEAIWSVRLYRDDVKGGWKGFMTTPGDDKQLGRQTYTVDQVNKMKKQTLEFTMNEQMAKQQLSKLPGTTVPEFTNQEQLVRFVHNVLLTGNEDQLRAVMIKTLSPQYFEKGSKVQLNSSGEQLVKQAVIQAYKGDLKYADEYCVNFELNSMSSANYWYIKSFMPDMGATLISVTEVEDGYAEGKPINKWKLSGLNVIMKQGDDATAYLNSFSDKKKLCAKDGAVAGSGNNAVASAATNSEVANQSSSQVNAASSSGNWKKGDKVMVKELLKWYPAVVLDTRPGEWFIHYDGYDAKYDLWVGANRIKNK